MHANALKQVIQELINDKPEQALQTIHEYLVARTQEAAGVFEAKDKDDEAIEAYGTYDRGMKEVDWRKTFKNQAALEKFMDGKENAKLKGSRKANESLEESTDGYSGAATELAKSLNEGIKERASEAEIEKPGTFTSQMKRGRLIGNIDTGIEDDLLEEIARSACYKTGFSVDFLEEINQKHNSMSRRDVAIQFNGSPKVDEAWEDDKSAMMDANRKGASKTSGAPAKRAPVGGGREPAEKKPAAEPTKYNEPQMSRLLDGVEGWLDPEARYKDVNIIPSKMEIEWVTQETYSKAENMRAARTIASHLRKKGVKGWTVKVQVRDNWNGPGAATKWDKVKV